MKFVILEPHDGGMMQPVFCVAPLQHDDLAKAFQATHRPVSAGFVEMDRDGNVRTRGYSHSLGLSPRPQDAGLIGAMIRATLVLAAPLPAPIAPA